MLVAGADLGRRYVEGGYSWLLVGAVVGCEVSSLLGLDPWLLFFIIRNEMEKGFFVYRFQFSKAKRSH